MVQPSINQVLLQIALDLSTSLPSGHHYQRLIAALNRVLPCEASALFIFDEMGFLQPVAVSGLSEEVLGKKFLPDNHPRLKAILGCTTPLRFPSTSELPDPFDGFLKDDPNSSIDVHDCMGCSLYVEDNLVGVLTLDAMQVGAFDQIDDITVETFAALAAATIRNITMVEALKRSNKKHQNINKLLIEEARTKGGQLVGISLEIQRLRDNIKMVAHSNYAVLISGETGTGKELVAHELHAQSQRSDKPMVYVNCAALPESIAESELFGHVKGAFTGANSHRAGKFELADSGTIFLDEIGELPLLLQAKLLRVIQQGEVQRVGADKNLFIDVRIIAATNRDLELEVSEGRFRSDLFHRLNVFPIHVPPLRERKGDIAVLTGHILDKVKLQFNINKLHVHPRSLHYLEDQKWVGNVRELEHTLMRAALRSIQDQQAVITEEHLGVNSLAIKGVSSPTDDMPDQPIVMREAVERYQKQLIEHGLKKSGGVWSKAADFLKMDRGNLYKMGKKLGVKP